jgi:acyl-coenzyme A synthetase/AMP-(fatty) acid ligase
VLDAPGGHEVRRGEEGLLHIAGRSLFRGYWGRTDPDLFFERDGLRFYNTGDVVRETPDDGYIYVGRRDRMVKRRGYRIELAEIERGLYQNEKLREVAAIALPDSSAGVRIIAYVTPHPGERPSIVELKTFCGRALPAYMNPDAFVILEGLPRTSTDKVDYQSLIRMNERQQSPA